MSRAQPITPWCLFSTACQLTYGSQKRMYPISGHDCREPVAFIALRANGATFWRFTFDASKRGSRGPSNIQIQSSKTSLLPRSMDASVEVDRAIP
jgi:hypothetical protein